MPPSLTQSEAHLFHHFIHHLGRWLDCTNAARIFTLAVSENARTSPVLLNAVLCFAARHKGSQDEGERAYERCIELLIEKLEAKEELHDECLLSAVLLLHFADQLESPNRQGCRDKHHLKGTSSILRSTMTTSLVDPSATSLREAAFWIYVRQSLYNATISQESLDIDFGLKMQPTVDSFGDVFPLSWLRSETAWANSILWTTACVADFCFSGAKSEGNGVNRTTQWQELWERCQTWLKKRPKEFNAIGWGPAEEGQAFSEIWFTADWHVISYVFYHFSCILLVRYKPDKKFHTRWVRSKLTPEDRKILHHVHAICAACKSSMQNAQLLIILSHTVFIWGPLLSDPGEQKEIVKMLQYFENTHAWRTAWIVDALKGEWGVE
ncbi:arca-like protein [Stagonosporopsis vannaccii]|nr:arca-like protein [Stagonosporopsis vannaccii]